MSKGKKKFIVIALGSLGDLYPMFQIAKTFQLAHDVIVACTKDRIDLINQENFDFYEIPAPEFDRRLREHENALRATSGKSLSAFGDVVLDYATPHVISSIIALKTEDPEDCIVFASVCGSIWCIDRERIISNPCFNNLFGTVSLSHTNSTF